MSLFQLDAERIAGRVRAGGGVGQLPSLAASVSRGAVGFTVVSLAGFAPWAVAGRWFHRHLGEGGSYAACAVVFIGLSGLLLHRLIIGPGSLSRFYKLFGMAFAVYAVAWMAGWMTLRGDIGGVVGLLAGTALMGGCLGWAFEARSVVFPVIVVLFLANALGYFGGGWIEGAFSRMPVVSIAGAALAKSTQGMIARLLWGVSFGLGMGAGLGAAFYLCQNRARQLLSGAMNPPKME